MFVCLGFGHFILFVYFFPWPRSSKGPRRSEKKVFFLNSQRAEFLKLRVHFWLLFLSLFEFYPAIIRNGKQCHFHI